MTDRWRLAGRSGDEADVCDCLLKQARNAVDAGIDVVQIRERDMEAAALSALVTSVVDLARGSRTKVVVNDRLDIALACGASGVQLPADSLPPAAVRAMAPPGFLVGRSVHCSEDAIAAAGDADYLIAGTVWPSESKPGRASLLGLAGLTAIVRAAAAPVLAIGGVTVERFELVQTTGAAGVAGIGLFMGPAAVGCRAIDLKETVKAAQARFDTPQGRF